MRTLIRVFCRVMFALVRNLPPSYYTPFPYGSHIRNVFARGILEECGKCVNIESGCRFGSGKGIRLEDNSGIGIRTEVRPYASIALGGAVVAKSIPPYSVAVGNPASVVRYPLPDAPKDTFGVE